MSDKAMILILEDAFEHVIPSNVFHSLLLLFRLNYVWSTL